MVKAKSVTRAPKSKAVTRKSTDANKNKIIVSASDVKKLRQFETQRRAQLKKLESLEKLLNKVHYQMSNARMVGDKQAMQRYKESINMITAKMDKEGVKNKALYDRYHSFVHNDLMKKKGEAYTQAAQRKAWPKMSVKGSQRGWEFVGIRWH